jgi:hypothetical protein
MRNHHIVRICAVWAAITSLLCSIGIEVRAGDTVGPNSSNANVPYGSEVEGDPGVWVNDNPDTSTNQTWTQTEYTTGGKDPEGRDFCQWEWTKTWHWQESMNPRWTTYSLQGIRLCEGAKTLWAYGALVGGLAYAYDISSNSHVEEIGAVIAGGTVEVRLISAPECIVCRQTMGLGRTQVKLSHNCTRLR